MAASHGSWSLSVLHSEEPLLNLLFIYYLLIIYYYFIIFLFWALHLTRPNPGHLTAEKIHQEICILEAINVCQVVSFKKIRTQTHRHKMAKVKWFHLYLISRSLAIMKAVFIIVWGASRCSRCLSWTDLPRPRRLWLQLIEGCLASAPAEEGLPAQVASMRKVRRGRQLFMRL